MRYVIEIEDEPFVRKSALYGEEALYRANGFKSLVFDETGLKKLTPLAEYMSKYESEREAFHVGDEVIKKKTRADGYVLIPDVGHGNFIVMMEGHAYPQNQAKADWVKKSDRHSTGIKDLILQAAEALKEEGK